jgi:hypothetical protein
VNFRAPAAINVVTHESRREGGAMRLHRSVVSFMSLVALLVVALAGTAAALGPPEMETITILGDVRRRVLDGGVWR